MVLLFSKPWWNRHCVCWNAYGVRARSAWISHGKATKGGIYTTIEVNWLKMHFHYQSYQSARMAHLWPRRVTGWNPRLALIKVGVCQAIHEWINPCFWRQSWLWKSLKRRIRSLHRILVSNLVALVGCLMFLLIHQASLIFCVDPCIDDKLHNWLRRSHWLTGHAFLDYVHTHDKAWLMIPRGTKAWIWPCHH